LQSDRATIGQKLQGAAGLVVGAAAIPVLAGDALLNVASGGTKSAITAPVKAGIKEGIQQGTKALAKNADTIGNSARKIAGGKRIPNAVAGEAREKAVTKRLKQGPGEVLEQRTIVGPDGKKLVASDGKGRRLDQVRVDKNSVSEAFETTSPTEALRSRKVQQVNRGDELITGGNAHVKAPDGSLIQIPSTVRTQVVTE